MSVAEWSPYVTYVAGDTVQYAGLYYTASATNRNVAPLPTNPTWVLSGSGGGGGIVTLSLAGDLISANPGGSSVDVGTATTVAATAQKTTKMTYDGILTTRFDGDVAIDAGVTQKILFTSSGDGTFDGTLKSAAIEDASGSLGTANQVLTAGSGGGSVHWTTPSLPWAIWKKSGNQTPGLGAPSSTNVTFDTTDAGSDTTTITLTGGGQLFTATVAGVYSFLFQYSLFNVDTATFTDRTFFANINVFRATGPSGTVGNTRNEFTNGVPTQATFQVSAIVPLAVGDAVRANIQMYNSANGSMVIARFVGETVNTSMAWTKIA